MVTDLTYLKSSADNNPELIKEMIAIFIEQVEGYIREIQKLLDDKNYIALGRLAHKAKSSIAIVGMNELAADLKKLEILTNEGLEETIYPIIVERFRVECQLAICELQKYVLTLEV
jgi:FOG: HPt domain